MKLIAALAALLLAGCAPTSAASLEDPYEIDRQAFYRIHWQSDGAECGTLQLHGEREGLVWDLDNSMIEPTVNGDVTAAAAMLRLGHDTYRFETVDSTSSCAWSASLDTTPIPVPTSPPS